MVERIPAPALRRRRTAPGARHQPRRLALRRPARALPGAQRDDPPGQADRLVSRRRHDRERHRRPPLRHRGARPRRGRRGGPRGDHRRRRHRRGDDRRDARRPRRPAATAGDHRRRAVAVDRRRDQQRSARRPRGLEADGPPDQGPPRPRAGRQRLDPGAGHRAPRRLGGARARRAAAGRAVGADAPRGLRARRQPAAGADPRGQRQALRAGRAARDRRPGGVRRGGHPDARPAQGPDGADDQPLDRVGAPRLPRPRARADRLPDRVPHRDARHRDPSPRLRGWEPWAGELRTRPTGRAGRRSPGPDGELRSALASGPRLAVRRPGRRRLRGDDRRRELARRGPRRQRDQAEAPDQRPRGHRPTSSCA